MSFEPEIIVTQNRAVFGRFAAPETLAVCWQASEDDEFERIFEHVRSFNQSASHASPPDETLLAPVEDYAQQMIENEINPVIDEMGPLSGFDPLHTWLIEPEDGVGEDANPHRDHACFGIFFYFNEQAGLSTLCIPEVHAGQGVSGFGHSKIYPDADCSKAIILPPRSVALIKLGELTHCSPPHIPQGLRRIVMHARYDCN